MEENEKEKRKNKIKNKIRRKTKKEKNYGSKKDSRRIGNLK